MLILNVYKTLETMFNKVSKNTNGTIYICRPAIFLVVYIYNNVC